MLLLKATRYKTSLVALKGTIRVGLDLVHPLARDRGNTRKQGHKIQSASMLQSSNLLRHRELPLRMSSGLTIGHRLRKSSSCEAIALRRSDSVTIMKIVSGRRRRS
uniref:Uncharacterized protein n=1 Tax=Phyllostachys edulis TaxID=38705 RepID=D3IVL8_PHYED|nr:hypothetical protein [Phyllostachys edulis]